ncbi:c-type cytochrome [Thioclava sp. FR2]|uniref:c-type cytochrome n=1 Tax=Thioclava sp. FR2 TaxID=3445780 RepID=UPI003EC080AF
MKYALIAAAAALIAAPVFAGDAAEGEAEFKKCKSCHSIVADDGTVIQKGGKTGPNLYGIIGRQIGTAADFKYSADLVAAGADGTVWDEASLAAFITDPAAWLKEKTGNAGAKSKMTFKLKDDQDDLAAYLASLKL